MVQGLLAFPSGYDPAMPHYRSRNSFHSKSGPTLFWCLSKVTALLMHLNIYSSPKRSFRQWSDELMLEMVDRINQGEKYQDVTKDTFVPISTLWTR